MTSYSVLIVEDSTLMRELLRFSVGKMVDVDFDEADDGLEGIRKLTQKRYDLVIADINMPVMDGLKLVRHMKSSPESRDIPVIIISTEGRKEDMDRAMKLGIKDYLTKPVTGKEVCDSIRRLLGME